MEWYPSKYQTLAQYWFYVGPTEGATLNQHWVNVSFLLGCMGKTGTHGPTWIFIVYDYLFINSLYPFPSLSFIHRWIKRDTRNCPTLSHQLSHFSLRFPSSTRFKLIFGRRKMCLSLYLSQMVTNIR